MALTDATIRHAKPTNTTVRLADGNGLYLEISPKGSKSFIFRYRWRSKTGAKRLGRYPMLSLAKAREMVVQAQARIYDDLPPFEKVEKPKTFKQVATLWLKRWRPTVQPRTYQKMLCILERNIYPHIGQLYLDQITGRTVLATLEKDGTTPRTAGMALTVIKQVFDFAVINEYAPHSPLVSGIRRYAPPYTVKNYPHMPVEELPAFFEQLHRLDTKPDYRLFLQLLILLFPRLNELLACKWSYLDLEKATLTIPSECMKGRKQQKEQGALTHVIQLPTQAVRLLGQLYLHTGNQSGGWMFPPTLRTHSGSLARRVLYKCVPPTKQTPHGFRAMASTWLNEHHPDRHLIIETMLAHKVGSSVSRVYNKAKHGEQRRELWQAWGDFLESQGLLGGAVDASP